MATRQFRLFGRVFDVVLSVSIIALISKLVPFDNWQSVIALLDVRAWNSGTWFLANAVLFASMLLIRFGPTVMAMMMRRVVRDRPSNEAGNRKMLMSDAEERALYQRLIEARKKQVM